MTLLEREREEPLHRNVDDAIHAMDLNGDLLCGLPAGARRKLGLEGFPLTDVDGSYCWTCLKRAEAIAP